MAQTVEVSAKFVNGKPDRIEALYIMKSAMQWDRFMRFMEHYAEGGGPFGHWRGSHDPCVADAVRWVQTMDSVSTRWAPLALVLALVLVLVLMMVVAPPAGWHPLAAQGLTLRLPCRNDRPRKPSEHLLTGLSVSG